MKAPGIRAKKTGKRLERGKALQVMTYPRLKTKKVLVEASRAVGLALSSFILSAAVKEAAAIQGCKIGDLVPADELKRYRAYRVYRKTSEDGKPRKRRKNAKRT